MVNNNITNRVYCSRKLGGRGSYPQKARVQRVNEALGMKGIFSLIME